MKVLRALVKMRSMLSRVPVFNRQTLSLLVLLTLAVWGLATWIGGESPARAAAKVAPS